MRRKGHTLLMSVKFPQMWDVKSIMLEKNLFTKGGKEGKKNKINKGQLP